MNVSEEVMLNCTVSSLPEPVYSWSIPDTCSSCPHSNSYSILTFTANSTDSGEYICTAENIHGNISMIFKVFVNGMRNSFNNLTKLSTKGCIHRMYDNLHCITVMIHMFYCLLSNELLLLHLLIFK